ncbi:hypothetical protein P171DRAFT_425548 [Karstenula rhodostoma CBS 690.94]|uniref:Uncharacterized protein n=1 Tax=Karstenula rhodostoma CBS 690.94 TaxID=1392251 RepID=A0A9P4P4H7_9PLEO|nr:hypothetical protein P171DRAFT_425548 [Karstenula rhodostoma CBS 690.94]
MTSNPSVFPFLRLPRELRDIIYRHYVDDRDGYVYDFERNKLTHANGDRIDLSFSLVCRQISSEIAGVALDANEVVFRTYCSEKTKFKAAECSIAIRKIRDFQSLLVNELAPRFLTSNVANTVSTCFPQFRPVLERWQSGQQLFIPNFRGTIHESHIPWGETRSAWVDFNHLVLSIISKLPGFIQEADQVVDQWTKNRESWRCNPTELVNAHPASWVIPGSEELSRMMSLATAKSLSSSDDLLRDFGTRFRYSAASLAIRFLQSHATVALSRIRKVILSEDQMSLTNSPSHVQGLVWFCRQNPKLQIERIVNLWTAGISPNHRPEYPLRTSIITKSFGRWIFEALELRKHGMPDGSFRLILDGNPIPEKASQVFGAVKGDAVRQAALDLCYERNVLPRPSWIERRRRWGYQWEELPQAIMDLQTGGYDSFIDCNFDLGAPFDPESLVKERLNWTAKEWEDEWELRQDDRFDTEAPLPPWSELHPMSIIDW